MMLIPTYVGPSRIHGLGLFSLVAIKKDTLLWSFEEAFDRRYTPEEFDSLHPNIHEYFKVYGYRDLRDGFYYISIDNDRFTNHSNMPNTYFDEATNWLAAKSIKKGEELTSNYRHFDADWESYSPIMRNIGMQEKISV
ncbi:MAG: SET domain-containing protein-lysine N-methyltransferase [Proteobacteria bacterium]|nr:SET domain-containing protein-lysine N-methyltransferase [Pseudomonadota bacterium]